MDKFDVVIVGAGTAVTVAAKTAAKLGLSTCLIDRKKQEDVGDKVCGDAVGKHHFDTIGITPPHGNELAGEIKGINVYSPDKETVFEVAGKGLQGFMINRREFGQRLLDEAVDAGAIFLDETQGLNLIIKKNLVTGIEAKNWKKNDNMEIHGKIVIDASGFDTIFRTQTPKEWEITSVIPKEDVTVCYREIRELNSTVEDQDYCKIYLNQNVAPGGYYWVFPKGERQVNIGLGVLMKRGFKNPKYQYQNHILNQSLFDNSRRITGGGGVVSTRRPINNMVGNGILFIGDAACQPNPIHGGGIGSSMLAGKIAAQTSSEAEEKGDFGMLQLWPYNTNFMMEYGAKAAGLDAFRIFLQKCTNEDLNNGMRQRIIKEEDILRASLGEDLRLNLTEKIQRVFKNLKKIQFVLALRKTAKKMKQIKQLYYNYPSIEGFSEWCKRVDNIIEDMKSLTF